jgi:hypothetical protein
MKKQLALCLVFLTLICAMTACRRAQTPGTTPGTSGGPSNLGGMKLSAIVDAIYANHPMELPLGTIDVDLRDSYAVKSYLGLDSSDKIAEAVASESMLGAQAYSLVLCRVKNAADAPAVAQQMRDGIDQRKWVCVNADDLMVSACGDVVMLVMISSDYAENGTAASLTEAFKKVCGTELTTQIR